MWVDLFFQKSFKSSRPLGGRFVFDEARADEFKGDLSRWMLCVGSKHLKNWRCRWWPHRMNSVYFKKLFSIFHIFGWTWWIIPLSVVDGWGEREVTTPKSSFYKKSRAIIQKKKKRISVRLIKRRIQSLGRVVMDGFVPGNNNNDNITTCSFFSF